MKQTIRYSQNNWYYSDGTAIKFVNHIPSVVWKSHDSIIRLIDYSDKTETNQLIEKLNEILYGDDK